jgi:hypothetical protein
MIYPITLIYKPTTFFQPLELKGIDFAWTDFISLRACSLKQIQKNLWALSIVLLAWF